MAAETADGRVERLVSWAASIVAPLSVLTAVLFYFGYASSRAQYAYFGLDVDTIGLSTQDYVIRSPQVLLTPLLGLVLVAAAVANLHQTAGRRIQVLRARSAEVDPETRDQARARLARILRLSLGVVLAGQLLVGVAAILLLAYPVLHDWPWYPLVTPCLIGLGAALVLAGGRVRGLLRPEDRPRPGIVVATSLVLVVALFWATATIADASGRGLAHRIARNLEQLPTVLVDSRERLGPKSPNVTETVLPASEAQTFRYRYRGLHLLIQGKDRMFLVPGVWTPSDFTLMVPMDGSVRLQFQFENSPP